MIEIGCRISIFTERDRTVLIKLVESAQLLEVLKTLIMPLLTTELLIEF